MICSKDCYFVLLSGHGLVTNIGHDSLLFEGGKLTPQSRWKTCLKTREKIYKETGEKIPT